MNDADEFVECMRNGRLPDNWFRKDEEYAQSPEVRKFLLSRFYSAIPGFKPDHLTYVTDEANQKKGRDTALFTSAYGILYYEEKVRRAKYADFFDRGILLETKHGESDGWAIKRLETDVILYACPARERVHALKYPEFYRVVQKNIDAWSLGGSGCELVTTLTGKTVNVQVPWDVFYKAYDKELGIS